LDEARAVLETLPDPEFFFNLPLSCGDDFFFEGMIMAVKTNTLSLQKKINDLKTTHWQKNVMIWSHLKKIM
jgi:hypothetical protein